MMRSIALGSIVFFLLLAIIFSLTAYFSYHNALLGLYEQQMTEVLYYVDSHIDHDDLAACANTSRKSAKYDELQTFMDDLYTNYEMSDLYILRPASTPDGQDVFNIATAFTPEDRAAGDADEHYLGHSGAEYYSAAEMEHLQSIADAGELVFFEQDEARFAIVMADLNHLKQVNDTFGHERGDDYIIGSVKEICNVFKRSPVYRIGGDEFTVILEGRDYEERNALRAKLVAAFRATEEDSSCEPWERYSASIGLAAFEPASDRSVDDVFARADREMYFHKQAAASR